MVGKGNLVLCIRKGISGKEIYELGLEKSMVT